MVGDSTVDEFCSSMEWIFLPEYTGKSVKYTKKLDDSTCNLVFANNDQI